MEQGNTYDAVYMDSWETGIATMTPERSDTDSLESYMNQESWKRDQYTSGYNIVPFRKISSMSQDIHMNEIPDGVFLQTSRLSSSDPHFGNQAPFITDSKVIDDDQRGPPIQDNTNFSVDQESGKERVINNVKYLQIIVLILAFLVLVMMGWIIALYTGPKESVTEEKRLPCPESWIWVNGSCYFFSDTACYWESSKKFCATHNSTLAILKEQQVLETIQRYKESRYNYWIALKKNEENIWTWLDGSPLTNKKVANDGSQLHCAYLNSHFGALDCSTRRHWICIKSGNESSKN
ncbi:uncharacterized protein O3C94_005337 isoform 1-T2 [Discoglossus pictus]